MLVVEGTQENERLLNAAPFVFLGSLHYPPREARRATTPIRGSCLVRVVRVVRGCLSLPQAYTADSALWGASCPRQGS
jgi:hypothetical protein